MSLCLELKSMAAPSHYLDHYVTLVGLNDCWFKMKYLEEWGSKPMALYSWE